MVDPLSLMACVAAIVSAIASGAHMMRRLFSKLRGKFGSACNSMRELSNLCI
ncbi:hypothetical protein K432DRAFT_376841 [Lepidopterella palustris CBS 459.81]|uniref:Uncharacterized protein n=1 Tax=Lepidopterella palustris CBS 459.81 TaxID=1314670 RepID=A0A8E2ELT6_9PEZI|nr:hypothetical protein K432DRAFT_376841 [Lepidopterella palustris CBS 459.81]